MAYKTRQRETIENLLKEKKDYALPAYEVQKLLNNTISKATVYRTLELLTQEQVLRKFYNELTSTYEYQYSSKENDCSHHLHLKCVKCGKLIHLHCSAASNFLSHIGLEHGFIVNQGLTIIYGLCSSCSLVKEKNKLC